MTNLVLKPPIYIEDYPRDRPSIFFAGSIEMGKAEDWQTELAARLSDVVIFNPRRDDWDSSWVQSIHNEQFKTQVLWEYNHLRSADLVVFYFQPGTLSPITLMELGMMLLTPTPKIVCCPEGFWRKGNVEVMCNELNVPLFEDKESFINAIIDFVERVKKWSPHCL